MKFWKRWLRFLTDEEEPEQPADGERTSHMTEHVEAKVVYQYPQGRFRFPLIPDDQAAEVRETPRRMAAEDNRRKAPRRPSAETTAEAAEKKPFRPSDVPSPVFGYYKHHSEQRQRVTEQGTIAAMRAVEKTDSGPVSQAAARPGEPAPPPRSSRLADAAAPQEALEAAGQSGKEEAAVADMKEEQAPAPLRSAASAAEQEGGSHAGGGGSESLPPAAQTEETRPDERDDRGDEQKEAPETDERNADSVSQEDEAALRSPLPVGENGHPAARSRPERARIPYNVMMLKQDRRKLEERSRRDGYSLPPLALLEPPGEAAARDEQWIHEQCARLDQTFASFHIGAHVVGATQGPTVTQFEVQPDLGVKVSKITSLTDDMKLSLAAKDIRIEAPIPGKRTIGIEVPNPSSRPVRLREILDDRAFRGRRSPLTVALGLDISGAPVVTDIGKMPHGLIAGATGSGKSVCMNAMLVSMLYKAALHEVKWLLIDPKMVELAPYNGLPHLLSPVITEAKAAAGALKWAVGEMERRYEQFVHAGVRDIEKYNEHLRERGGSEPPLPYIVIVIDELADLMMAAPADVEESICRLAQKARACGIHLLIATQRPSVDVITGLIKANIPTRIAFSVSSQVDSRTILDVNGAERLLGRGDMLFLENGSAKPVRLQGCFISDEEIERVTAHVKAQQGPSYMFSPDEFRQTAAFGEEDDELFEEACRFVIAQGGASTSSLQRHFRIGYNRAARLIEMMEEQGLISEARGSKPRDVLMSEEEWTRWREQRDVFSPSGR